MNILIINHAQFGYHSDTWYYCKYLSKEHAVSYVGWDYGREKRSLQNVNVEYVSRDFSLLKRVFFFVFQCNGFITKSKFDVVFIKYFPFCFILRILNPSVKFVFDIRTGSVLRNPLKRFLQDSLMKFESLFFNKITIISESLRCKLKYPVDSYILPLGADVISECNIRKSGLHLIYVGTLHGREIEKTIEGLGIFYKNNPSVDCSYNIIGTGFPHEVALLNNAISNNELSEKVHLLGFINHDQLAAYFEKANLGVSFVPKTPFYDSQPVTKTFEYLLSGLPVIATSTAEHLKVINENVGVLTEDNSESFSLALEKALDCINENKFTINQEQLRRYNWENICSELSVYLSSVVDGD